MSRKRDRKELKQFNAQLWNQVEEISGDAEEFLLSAAPLEISTALFEIGASTVDESGIFALLDEAFQNPTNTPQITIEGIQLIEQNWQKEISAKSRNPEMESSIFLLEAARFFTQKWLIKKFGG